MNSLRARMAVWFGFCFLLVSTVQMGLTYHGLNKELRQKSWRRDYPEHPDWKLHGSYSDAEVQDVLGELMEMSLLGSAPLVLIAGLLGYWLARKSLRPIASVNQQLASKDLGNLGQPVQLLEADLEFRELLRQLNELLARLEASFKEMNHYAAKVAHELRTPLAILRLKVEQAGSNIAPDLSEELQAELHRLGHVVDQSLLIARVERGVLAAHPVPEDLSALMREIVEDFALLAAESGRSLAFEAPETCWVKVDRGHLHQVVHGLLTNALKHGVGDLKVRVKTGRERATLTLANRKSHRPSEGEPTLGLGLRVVSALLRLDPHLVFRSRRGTDYHAVRLSCPLAGAKDAPPEPLAR